MNAASTAAPQQDRPREVLPTRRAAIVFRAKAACFQLRRWLADRWSGPSRHPRGQSLAAATVIGGHGSDLWLDAAVAAERKLQLGKVQNLRTAARQLDGLEVPAGALWSFWRQLGRPVASRGYAIGRELREGCLIPTIGGGLCQLSGAIYNAALQAGLEVVERHRHSHPGVGPLAALGRDATIFWNYVDLRLRAPFAWRLEVRLSASRLTVRMRRAGAPPPVEAPASAGPADSDQAHLGSCASCGVSRCFRHVSGEDAGSAPTAWVVDECAPEWLEFVSAAPERPDFLVRPLDGRRWGKPNYAWPAERFRSSADLTWTTLRRAWATRRLREQGAERQRALLHWDERLAQAAADRLRPEHSHLVIAQNLLPYLWREGFLGGRTFEVLMTRLPLAALQAALDRAAALHPESRTCADFRAPARLVEDETEALAAAVRWLTPHTAVAALARERARQLPWARPLLAGAPMARGERVLFPASTLGRKGAYELRDAARELDLEIVCLGAQLEGPEFWRGVRLAPPDPSRWLEGIAAVVLPAFVEHRPRRLLAAAAAGVPVIASDACGLGGVAGVTEIPAGDGAALGRALRAVLARSGE